MRMCCWIILSWWRRASRITGPRSLYHVPAPGDAVPDFKLRNQDGRRFTWRSSKARRCWSRSSTRAARAQLLPARDAELCRGEQGARRRIRRSIAKTHLLCVSFDPEHDTPERLRAYGATYIGSDAAGAFDALGFCRAGEAGAQEMAKFFDVGITSGPDETITHTLSTTLIGPDGKVVRFYPGNEWTVEQVTRGCEGSCCGQELKRICVWKSASFEFNG
jgi:protein SCO1/2